MKLDVFAENEPVGDWPVPELMGFLMWIANAVRAVARSANKTTEARWRTAIDIFKISSFSTIYFGIAFRKGSVLELVACTDDDHVSTSTNRRSVSGGAVMCAGVCVYLFSRTQKHVTRSTTEAEYVVLEDTLKEAMVMRQVSSIFFRLR